MDSNASEARQMAHFALWEVSRNLHRLSNGQWNLQAGELKVAFEVSNILLSLNSVQTD